MYKLILKRSLAIIPTLLGLLFIVFMIIRLIPGDPALLMLAESDFATVEDIELLRKDLNLDKPIWDQYILFMLNFFQGNLGESIVNRQPVLKNISLVYIHTVYLTIGTILVSVLIGVPAGILAASKRNRLVDRITMIFSMIGISMPSFWFGIMLILGMGVYLGWFPILGASDLNDPIDYIRHLVLPSISIGFSSAALVSRMTRSSMLDVIDQDYIRTARAKGASERRVVYKHALKNALIPVITIVGLNAGWMMGGALVSEIVFARPGVGRLLVDSIFRRDYPQIQGCIFIFALSVTLVNLFVDIAYIFIDPRVKKI